MYKFTEITEENKAPVSTGLLARMQEDILTGEMRPGEKIIEQKLCEKYGASRTPVREALKQLEADGLVEYILNRGYFVIGMSDRDFEDMFDLRKACEIQAVKWAIERITEEEMERLEETFEFMEFYTMRSDTEKMLVINAGFHQIIYEASKNRMLQKLLTSLQSYLKYKSPEVVQQDNYLTTVLEEHRAIFKAFMDEDPREGGRAMEIHINRAKERRCG
ncbi:MAG: GntR family transcriptional regulator [Clostridiales bacterium]|nr:GntR family transcriptional regulator [Clostridiales bacterium]